MTDAGHARTNGSWWASTTRASRTQERVHCALPSPSPLARPTRLVKSYLPYTTTEVTSVSLIHLTISTVYV